MNKFKAPAAFSEKPYQHIALTAVESNQVKAVGYSPERNVLAMTFTSGPGHIYHYPNVHPSVFDALMAAESKGKFFGDHIKTLPFDKFPAEAAQAVAEEVTPNSIAAKLHGIEYPCRIPQAINDEAKAAGIVIVYGASDDLMELDGAIRDEFGCHDGGTAKVDAQGLLRDWDSVKDDGEKEEIAAWVERDKTAKEIKAVWEPATPEGASWAYETTIPHTTFDVMEDGQIYCRGIVFALADLSQ